MKRLVPLLILWLAALPLGRAHATEPAVVIVPKKGGTSEATLAGRADNGVRLRPSGAAAGEYLLTFDQIAEIRFVFPASVNQAQEALNQSQWELAAAILRPVADSVLPYLDILDNNAVSLVMVLADSLRRANKLPEALIYYDKVRLLTRTPDAVRAAISAAQCHVSQNRPDQAWKTLQSVDPPKRESDLLGQYRLARARVRLAQKDFPAALDEVAQSIVFSRIESEWFPESLYVSAQCYEALNDTNLIRTALSKSSLVQATLPQTNRVQAAVFDTKVAQSLTGNTNYVRVAEGIYKEITVNFPNTSWAKLSQARLAELVPSEATNTTETVE